MNLAVVTEHAPQGRTIVRICGELDIATAPDLRDQLLVILDRQTPSRLIIDLSELEFMDSSGSAVLVNTDRRARLMGCTLALAAPQQAVLRVLQICGLDRHFLMFDDVSSAAGTGEADPQLPLHLRLLQGTGDSDRAASTDSGQAHLGPLSLQGVFATARLVPWHRGYRPNAE